MGAKLTLYNAIRDRIADKVKDINHIAKWNNQTNNEATEFPFDFPAVFIGFPSIEWEASQTNPYNTNLANFQQTGNVTVTLYIAFWYKQEESVSWEDYEPIINKVWTAVNGLQGDSFTPMQRTSEREDNNHGSVIVWEMDFTTRLTECVEEGDKVLIQTPISVQITGDLIINPVTDDTIRTAGDFDEDP